MRRFFVHNYHKQTMFRTRKTIYHFATLALAEHNGKVLSKNTLKLLTAAHKLKEEVTLPPIRHIFFFAEKLQTS